MDVEHFPRDPSALIYADITGRRFSSLVAQTYIGLPTSRKWLCICDCGESVIAFKYNLINGTKTTCGAKHPKPEKPVYASCSSCGLPFSTLQLTTIETQSYCPRCKDASNGLNEEQFYRWVKRVHSQLTAKHRMRDVS